MRDTSVPFLVGVLVLDVLGVLGELIAVKLLLRFRFPSTRLSESKMSYLEEVYIVLIGSTAQ